MKKSNITPKVADLKKTEARKKRQANRRSKRDSMVEKRVEHWKARVGYINEYLKQTQKDLTAANSRIADLEKKLAENDISLQNKEETLNEEKTD